MMNTLGELDQSREELVALRSKVERRSSRLLRSTAMARRVIGSFIRMTIGGCSRGSEANGSPIQRAG